ncbi:MAG: MarR family transcriptional regulator [Cohaesibacter sp.]|jgi:DNA-binding MarR family transcriptional regulator|nr:MarR family transcriptional regulator [Cohaesibacter sp.]
MATDSFQVSMFDALPDMAPPSKDEGKEARASKTGKKAKAPVAPLAAEEAFTLDNFLPYRMLASAQAISKRMARVLADEWDMSLAEWQVLASLSRDGAVSVREVEPRTLLDTVAVSRAAKRLTDRKLLRRDVNKQDKRLVVLKPTKKGRDIASAIGLKVMELEGEFLKGMNVQDRIRLSQLLKTVA